MRKPLIAALATLLLTACAGSAEPIAKQYFVLGLDDRPATDMPAPTGPGIALTRLTLANYLNEPGIAMILSNNRINIAAHSLWGEELYQTIPRILADDLKRACNCPVSASPGRRPTNASDSALGLRIDRFGPTDQGTVILSGEMQLDIVGGTRAIRPFHFEKELSGDGYGPAVQTMRELVPELAAFIAGNHAGSVQSVD